MLTWLEPELPGVALSRSPGSGARSLDADLAQIAAAGVGHIICLQEEFELKYGDPPQTVEARRATVVRHGMRFTHSPVEDFAAPELEQVTELVGLVETGLSEGRRVLVHCFAGLGRAGTVAACLLVRKGMSPEGAIAMVRYQRPGAVQSAAQEALIAAFAQSLLD